MERKAFNDQYVAWIQQKIQSEYPEDIALALIYGSYINGTAGSKSDVDCYFIPKTERGYALARTFLFDGVGYDLFPMSWERVERIAGLEEGLPPLLGDVEILYRASPEDASRFASLQALLKKNLQNEDYTRSVAAKKCGQAAAYCGQLNTVLPINQIRKIAGGVIMTLADAVALYNREYYHRGTKMQYHDLLTRFPAVPKEIAGYYRQVAEATDKDSIIYAAMGMLEAVCRYMAFPLEIPRTSTIHTPTIGAPDASRLAELYEEISATFQKIYLCCENGNHILAFLSAAVLQSELDQAMELGCPALDILSSYAPDKLPFFAASVHDAENNLVAQILENGASIRHYHSFSEFSSGN